MALAEDFDYSERSGWRRRLVPLVLLLVVVGGAAFGGWWYFLRDDSPAAAAAAEQDATVTTGNLVSSFSTTGTANAQLNTKVTFGGTGTVKAVSVAVGDKVTSGQELARLDDADAQRTLQSAATGLASAQLKVTTLTNPPTVADVAAATAAVENAKVAVATAQDNLTTATSGPTATDLATADAAINSAQNALANANNSVDSAWTALLSAQQAYCTNDTIQFNICYLNNLPLTTLEISQLNQEVRNPGGTDAQGNTVSGAAQKFISANAAWLSAKASIVTAQANVDSATTKKSDLYTPPTATKLAQLNAAILSAQSSVLSAQAKLDQLNAGPTATDLQAAQQSVQQAQVTYDKAQDAIDALVMRAPFDGVVGAATLNVGDPATADSATITNPDLMRVDLTVSESDLPGLKKGQYGIATFDALPGNTYLVKITSVATTPTVTQGVVTYPVQAQILRTADLQQDATELESVATALLSLSGGGTARGTFTGTNGASASGTPGAGAANRAGRQAAADATPFAGRTPGAQADPSASRTPGANGFGGAGGAGGVGFLAALGSAPLPAQGMSATVIMLTSVKSNVLLLPTGAIKRSGRQSYVVLKKDDGTTENVNITIGGTDPTNTEIASGLTEGQKVISGAAPTTAATRTTTPTTGQGIRGGAGGTFAGPGGGVTTNRGGAAGGIR
jgi:multidrug efflux pump subunit AcrA (membrane-fusion protein)